LTGDPDLADVLQRGFDHAPISTADRAMLAYADKLTRTPGQMADADVQALRDAGFSHAAILDICQVTAYFAFANRIAGGLGVELETDRTLGL